MRDDLGWEVWSSERQRRVEHVLEQAMPKPESPVAKLAEAMRYSTLGGGKRVRALLCYAAGDFAGADPLVVDAAAAAVEMIHAYSLIHDDLPCMDDDDLRRGKPSCHIAFGEATAMLAGDALQALAFEVLGGSAMRNAGVGCAILGEASGALGMAGGQAIDLDSVGCSLSLPSLEDMHRRKTGALIRASVRLGAACGAPPGDGEAGALDAYAAAAGLAFQIVDDVLDVEGSSATLGKTAGKDAASGKPTYVAHVGLEPAKLRAERLRLDAHAAIAAYGGRARRLTELADWIALRRH